MLKRWQLDATHPLWLELAADARLSSTDYTDDQVWRLSLGTGESPALALQTNYGGRVGLASLVPMWVIENRTIYQSIAYATPPILTAFAPNYLQAEAKLTPRLALRAEYMAFESHAIGGQFTLTNSDSKAISVHLSLFAHVGANNRELRLGLLTLPAGGHALHLGQFGGIAPVVVLDNGRATESSTSKIGADITVPANGSVTLRWAHGAVGDAVESLTLAGRWLGEDWSSLTSEIESAAAHIPVIETGNAAQDSAIAFSYQQLVQSFLRPTASLPHASFVETRHHDRGFSPRGDGSDHIRAWSGQNPTLAYLAGLAIAPVHPEFAQGILLNYLATQHEDGWIDWRPGLAGQRQGLLCMPILARLAWGIFQYSEQDAFLREAYPRLVKFFDRWFASDLDRDSDGLPEWQAEAQTGYPYFPAFAINQPWGQHADIQTVESPDLAAYLLSEAISLREIAYYLHDEAGEQRMSERAEAIAKHMESLWAEDRYTYRDRDTHQTSKGQVLLEGGAGDEQHFIAAKFNSAARVIVRVSGGLERVPNMILHLYGRGADGNAVHEVADADAFIWTQGRGVYTSQQAFTELERAHIEGLIRAYKVHIATPDTTRLDLNALLPLWSVNIPPERAAALVTLLTNPQHFWRANGVTMASAQDPQFDPANEKGSGGIWPFWLTLIGEGLIEQNRIAEATDLLKRLLHVQTQLLSKNKEFSEFYHSDQAVALGEGGNLKGIVPLHLLMRVLGIRVISSTKVWTGGKFAWGSPVTLTQRGITVRRSAEGVSIEFPSGQTVELAADAPWQEVTDPALSAPPAPEVEG